MAARSLTATPDSIEHINRALTEQKWSREDLAKECDCSRQPAVKFCSGKAVSKKLFVSFCEALALDWEEIAGLKTTAPVIESAEPITDINDLVQTIRQQVYADIHHRCGTMRVLDMEHPIGIGDIYTSVNILEKLSGRRRLGLNELLQDCDLENFDRFLLGQIHHERVPGLEAVERHRQLMVLGKPGAGKTTFMKRLATLCNHGKFQEQRVPVFVTLKEFAEAKGQPDLQTYIRQQWAACGIEDTEVLAQILGQGRALILLDGLDEVQETDHDRILQEIKDFTGQYRDCQFVMTCRIAAREYTFQHFTEVEVADFDKKQIAEFATKWFTTKQDPEKGKTFIQRLADSEPIQELATNPLLLTLLCLVFGEANDFPANRSELYKEGLDVLLKKWDAKRNIERDQVYKKLSLKRKEDLLSQLAFATFTQGDYFFKQSVVERHILDYIRNLPGAQDEEEALQLDSEAVLKSIEAQHGLLVERARGIYSFSHLTFQEYFTARQITRPTAQLPQSLANLVQHLTAQRYREIFLLSTEMLPSADELLVPMKRQIDLSVVDDNGIQSLLDLINQKSLLIKSCIKPPAVRASYLSCNLSDKPYLNYEFSKEIDPEFEISTDFELDIALSYVLELSYVLSRNQKALHQHISNLFDLTFQIHSCCLEEAALKSSNENIEFINKFRDLRNQLPCPKDPNYLQVWWQRHGENWIKGLRCFLIKYRGIGQELTFTHYQQEKLQSYYNENLLLIQCLNSDCYVTQATRQYIEDTLLLPMSEIEKKNAEYGIS